MSNGEIDRLQVNQLEERYNGLARSAVYKRLNALGIEAERVGNKAFINAEQLRLLDDLHEFIQGGGTTAEFLESRGLPKKQERRDPAKQDFVTSSDLSFGQPDLLQFAAYLATEVAAQMRPPLPEPDVLAKYKNLEAAAQAGWVIKTSEVAKLLELSPSEVQQYGDSFTDAGFVFTKTGYRGGEIAWRVSKPLR